MPTEVSFRDSLDSKNRLTIPEKCRKRLGVPKGGTVDVEVFWPPEEVEE